MFDDTNARGNQTPGFEEWQTIQQPTEKRQNMVGVWWLTPLSTRFQLYHWGRTINGRHNNTLYSCYFSHWICSINTIFKVNNRGVTFELYLSNIWLNHQFTILWLKVLYFKYLVIYKYGNIYKLRNWWNINI